MARLVDQRDDLFRDHRLQPREAVADLREQVIVERALASSEAVEIDSLTALRPRQADRIAGAVVVTAFFGHIVVAIVARVRRDRQIRVRCHPVLFTLVLAASLALSVPRLCIVLLMFSAPFLSFRLL